MGSKLVTTMISCQTWRIQWKSVSCPHTIHPSCMDSVLVVVGGASLGPQAGTGLLHRPELWGIIWWEVWSPLVQIWRVSSTSGDRTSDLMQSSMSSEFLFCNPVFQRNSPWVQILFCRTLKDVGYSTTVFWFLFLSSQLPSRHTTIKMPQPRTN